MRFALAAVLLLSCCGGALSQTKSSGLSSDETAADDAAYKAVCGRCHATSFISGLRTRSEWLEEIEQMMKIGARATDDQFERVLRVLQRTLTKVNINSAPASEIAPVLDVSESTAEHVIKRRTVSGGFKSLEELKKIPGLDAAKLDARKDRIVF